MQQKKKQQNKTNAINNIAVDSSLVYTLKNIMQPLNIISSHIFSIFMVVWEPPILHLLSIKLQVSPD